MTVTEIIKDHRLKEVTEAEYQAAIPKCCFYQTSQEHVESLMLCWGLLSAIKGGYPMNCGNCEMIKEKANG